MKKKYYAILLIFSIIFQASAGTFFKLVSISMSKLDIISLIGNFYYAGAIFFLILQALTWQQVLKYYNLSYAYPLMSLVNFLVLGISFFIFSENINGFNIMGLSFISLGVYVLTSD